MLYTIENEALSYSLNERGAVVSIVNKLTGHEYCAAPGELFTRRVIDDTMPGGPVERRGLFFGVPGRLRGHFGFLCGAVFPGVFLGRVVPDGRVVRDGGIVVVKGDVEGVVAGGGPLCGRSV